MPQDPAIHAYYQYQHSWLIKPRLLTQQPSKKTLQLQPNPFANPQPLQRHLHNSHLKSPTPQPCMMKSPISSIASPKDICQCNWIRERERDEKIGGEMICIFYSGHLFLDTTLSFCKNLAHWWSTRCEGWFCVILYIWYFFLFCILRALTFPDRNGLSL